MASATRSAGVLRRLPRFLHSSTRSLPRALEEELRPGRAPMGYPRLFSSDSVGSTSSHRDSCKLNMGHKKHMEEENRLRQPIDSRLASIQMELDEDGRFWRATREQVRVLLKKKIEREEEDKRHERVVVCVSVILALALFAGNALFG